MNTFGSMILDTIGITTTRARVQVLSLLKKIHVNYLRLRVPFGRRRRKPKSVLFENLPLKRLIIIEYKLQRHEGSN